MAGNAGRSRSLGLSLLVLLAIIILGAVLWMFIASLLHKPQMTAQKPLPTSSTTTAPEAEEISSTPVSVGGAFTVAVPSGWTARVSTQQNFLAIQMGSPGHIDSLRYDKNTPASIDYSGIPAWNGLTEHLYIRAITSPSQAFKPQAHQEVTSEPFTFDDGTQGTLYSVTKHADEAKKWSGLLKDNEWYGRVYVYKKGDMTIEAHFAYYPSTAVDHTFFTKVIKTVRS